MISAIRSNYFTNQYRTNIKNSYPTKLPTQKFDSVCFSGKQQAALKLSKEGTKLIQDFAEKLQLNKVYKFDTPDVEKFQIATMVSNEKTDGRTLLIQYSGYSDNNITKSVMCTISEAGEVFESGNPVKNNQEIAVFEQIIPELINRAAKELKLKA